MFFHVGFLCSVDRELYNSGFAASMFFSGVFKVLPGILYGILGIPCFTSECCMFPEKRRIVFPLPKGGFKQRLTYRVEIGFSLQDLNRITKSCEVCLAGRSNIASL